MADRSFAGRETVRRLVLAVLAVWVVLFALDVATGNRWVEFGVDALVAALAVGTGVGYLYLRGYAQRLLAVAAVLFVVGGVAVGYDAVAKLGVVPRFGVVVLLSDLAILGGLVLFLYVRHWPSR